MQFLFLMSHYDYYLSVFTFTAVKSPIRPCDSKLFCSKCRRSDKGLSFWIFFKWTNECNLDEMSKRFTSKHVSIREHQELETITRFLMTFLTGLSIGSSQKKRQRVLEMWFVNVGECMPPFSENSSHVTSSHLPHITVIHY